eukprot:jgi/Mesvir1/16575/Mv10111-RA.1
MGAKKDCGQLKYGALYRRYKAGLCPDMTEAEYRARVALVRPKRGPSQARRERTAAEKALVTNRAALPPGVAMGQPLTAPEPGAGVAWGVLPGTGPVVDLGQPFVMPATEPPAKKMRETKGRKIKECHEVALSTLRARKKRGLCPAYTLEMAKAAGKAYPPRKKAQRQRPKKGCDQLKLRTLKSRWANGDCIPVRERMIAEFGADDPRVRIPVRRARKPVDAVAMAAKLDDFAERSGYYEEHNAPPASLKALREWMKRKGMARVPAKCPKTAFALNKRKSLKQCTRRQPVKVVRRRRELPDAPDYAYSSDEEQEAGIDAALAVSGVITPAAAPLSLQPIKYKGKAIVGTAGAGGSGLKDCHQLGGKELERAWKDEMCKGDYTHDDYLAAMKRAGPPPSAKKKKKNKVEARVSVPSRRGWAVRKGGAAPPFNRKKTCKELAKEKDIKNLKRRYTAGLCEGGFTLAKYQRALRKQTLNELLGRHNDLITNADDIKERKSKKRNPRDFEYDLDDDMIDDSDNKLLELGGAGEGLLRRYAKYTLKEAVDARKKDDRERMKEGIPRTSNLNAHVPVYISRPDKWKRDVSLAARIRGRRE